jgi:hypothetical protein
MHRASVLTLLALLLAPQLLAWTPPERVDRRPEGYHASAPAVAVDPSGGVHAVWTETPASGFQDKIMYAWKLGDTWSVPVFISRDSGDIRAPRIISDTAGHLIVVWSEEGAARIRYVRQLGDTWSVPKLAFLNNGITPCLAADSRNRVHMLFEEFTGHGGIWYSYYLGQADSWAAPQAVATASRPLGFSGLAVDRLDRLHAAWGDWNTYGLGYSRKDSCGWSAPVALPDPAPGSQSCDPSIAVDTCNLPHVVWQERSGGYLLYYSRQVDDTWTTPYRFYDQSGGYQVVGCDSANRLHAVWGWSYGVRHSVRTDSGWSTPTSVTDSAQAPLPDLALSSTLTHVAWRQDWGIYYSQQPLVGAVEECSLPNQQRPGLQAGITAPGAILLSYWLSCETSVTLTLYDLSGRCVYRTGPTKERVGTHTRLLPAVPDSGVYFIHMVAGNRAEGCKAIIVK